MTPRYALLAMVALLFFSRSASAQVRADVRRSGRNPQTAVQSFGSYERTKLLALGRGRGGWQTKLQLGSAERRALLTTGRLHPFAKKPDRRSRR